MVKHKVISKYGITRYVIKSKKGQQLDEMAVQTLRTNEVPGLLRAEVNRKHNSFQLIYDVTGFKNFQNFVKNPITKNVFMEIVQSIQSVFLETQNRHMEIRKINFDWDSVYVNPATNRLFFIYIPVTEFDNEMSLKSILETLPSQCVLSQTEDTGYVREFTNFLSSNTSITTGRLDDFLNTQNSQYGQKIENSDAFVTCPDCGNKLAIGYQFCGKCGKRLDSSREKRKDNEYDPLAEPIQDDYSRTGDSSSFFQSSESFHEKKNGTTVLSNGSMMGEDYNKTTVLNPIQYPYLIRQYNDEKISISQSPFRLGRERQRCNYYVPDNSAVSRVHADITSENGKYYIEDQGSVNYTYLEGRLIEQHKKFEIVNGMKIRLANEDFTFFIPEEENDGVSGSYTH